MGRQEEQTVLRLWFDWCRLWPEEYAHDSLAVKPGGYDPVFDVIPSQAYKDFYYEVIRDHPTLKHLNPFEVVDIALNQIPAPERPIVVAEPEDAEAAPVQAGNRTDMQTDVRGELVDLARHAPQKGPKHGRRTDVRRGE